MEKRFKNSKSVLEELKQYKKQTEEIVFNENSIQEIYNDIIKKNKDNYKIIKNHIKKYSSEGNLLIEMNFYKTASLKYKLSNLFIEHLQILISEFYINHKIPSEELYKLHDFILSTLEENYIKILKCYSEINSSKNYNDAIIIRNNCMALNHKNPYLYLYTSIIYYQNSYLRRAYFEMKNAEKYVSLNPDNYKDLLDKILKMIDTINNKYYEIYDTKISDIYYPDPNILFIITSGERYCDDNGILPVSLSGTIPKVFDPLESINTQKCSYRKWLIDHGTNYKYHRSSVGSNCPGRATLLTGQYSSTHNVHQSDIGMKDANDPFVSHLQPHDVGTLGNYLSDSGYDTIFKGFWNLSKPKTKIQNAQIKQRNNDELNTFGFAQWENNNSEKGYFFIILIVLIEIDQQPNLQQIG